nr:6-phosphogluconate dehydrogenase, decarboxylating [Pelodiscus sinensis]|eukprot:XP_006127194.1 6-phosphogluconate dehydrogenase, decarboxylating [Pelodiscus sinensis]
MLLFSRADIALIGLAVMGQNLILNMNDHGFVVCAFNRTVSKVDAFLANEAKGTKVIGAHSLQEMVSKLKKPRRIILLVKAGSAVDDFIKSLVPLLEAGDIIIDGGNSEYRDTTRRCKELREKGILFVGSGVSGGEEGARNGPSLMPGGDKEAWPHIKEIFQSIAAKVNTGEPCCDWVGEEGAGHFVKMVHNGIEYGDMQLICEAYHLMKDVLGMEVFGEWNKTELDSFLIEITANIFKFRDSDGKHLLPKIRDSAGQKGTGKWTAISALEYGVPVTLIGEAVFARCLSSLKDERVQASKRLDGPKITPFREDKKVFLEDIRKAQDCSIRPEYACVLPFGGGCFAAPCTKSNGDTVPVIGCPSCNLIIGFSIKVFGEWNKTELDSFLIEITANIFKFRDSDGKHLLPKIRDSAGQKGTGKWTAISALEYGVPVTLIGEAVFARCLSSLKDERVQASKRLDGPKITPFREDKKVFLEDIRKALYASKIISYAQGFMLLRQAAKEFGWTINYGGIALMWRGGCIIRSAFLGKIKDAFDRNPDLQNLLLDNFFKKAVEDCQDSWRRVISTGVRIGIPMPCFTTALSFYDGYRHEILPANLIQAQRDYFGAHTYELLSKPGEFIHTNWTGHGGNVSSSSYNA